MTAQHWRTIRLKLSQGGIDDPMAMRNMHVLLDVTESLILESMVSDKPDDDRAQRQSFIDSLYRPVAVKRADLPDGWRPPPFDPDADDDSNEAAFDAIAKSAH